jgi:hypothetical protein
MSDPCSYCGDRFYVAPGGTRDSERRYHEARCAMSIDCGYCSANQGERCRTRAGRPAATHESRREHERLAYLDLRGPTVMDLAARDKPPRPGELAAAFAQDRADFAAEAARQGFVL